MMWHQVAIIYFGYYIECFLSNFTNANYSHKRPITDPSDLLSKVHTYLILHLSYQYLHRIVLKTMFLYGSLFLLFPSLLLTKYMVYCGQRSRTMKSRNKAGNSINAIAKPNYVFSIVKKHQNAIPTQPNLPLSSIIQLLWSILSWSCTCR